ncbi:MAG: M17 family peptidase N-terminal domain-containing protein, partial [Mycobacteriales bacterium]
MSPSAPTVRAASTSPTTVRVDALVVGMAVGAGGGGPVPVAGAAEVDAALGGRLAATLAALGATGRVEETVRVSTLGATTAPVVLAVGLGPEASGYPAATLRRASGAAIRALAGTRRVATTLAQAGEPGEPFEAVRAVAEGCLLGAYDYVDYRTTSRAGRPTPVEAITVLVTDPRDRLTVTALTRAEVLAKSVAFTRDLVNVPAG